MMSYPKMNRAAMPGRPGLSWFAVAFVCVEFALTLPAQDLGSGPPDTEYRSAPDEPVQIWEFGLRITAAGPVSSITATVPVPIEWPEQSLKEIEEALPAGVTRLETEELGETARRLVIRIRRMEAGQMIVVSRKYEVRKRNVLPPPDSLAWTFADPVPPAFRTYLQPSPYIESNHRRIRELADAIEINGAEPAWRQVESLYQWVRDQVEYKFDPQIRSCVDALDRRQGDCEELSSLFIALCRARGIPARAVWIPEHTYPEFLLQGPDGSLRWFPCQLAGAYEFGGMSESRPVIQKGDRFRIAGHREAVRYVQPTLVAKDAPVPPSLQWIMQRIDSTPPTEPAAPIR
jgi:transglutaminase-like putative cysteine protease